MNKKLDYTLIENKSSLIQQLQLGVVNITFSKADGTTRHMRATLYSQLMPVVESKISTKKKSENSLPVWDLDKLEWRSFRYDTIMETNF
jgi:hypothetical protein